MANCRRSGFSSDGYGLSGEGRFPGLPGAGQHNHGKSGGKTMNCGFKGSWDHGMLDDMYFLVI